MLRSTIHLEFIFVQESEVLAGAPVKRHNGNQESGKGQGRGLRICKILEPKWPQKSQGMDEIIWGRAVEAEEGSARNPENNQHLR